MEMELRNPVTQLENSKQSLTSRTNKAEGRLSSLKIKGLVPFISKEYEKLKKKQEKYI